jgi:DHA2 family multidrug resistance protein
VSAPLAAHLSTKVDPRKLVFFGVTWLGVITLLRTQANLEMGYWQVGLPLLAMGIGLPFFFVPITGLALASVNEPETASAAGLMNFCRTLSGAFATSLVNTSWEDRASVMHAELSGLTDRFGEVSQQLQQSGFSADQALNTVNQMVQAQAVMLSTNQIFMVAGCTFVLAALAVWLAPKPQRAVDVSAAH